MNEGFLGVRLIDRKAARSSESDELEVIVFAPQPSGDTAWVCEYSIATAGSTRNRQGIYGVDAIQALVLCLQTISAHLQMLRNEGAELTWLGDADLGFSLDKREGDG